MRLYNPFILKLLYIIPLKIKLFSNLYVIYEFSYINLVYNTVDYDIKFRTEKEC